MGITNESVFEYCYYEYFVVDAHFDSLLNKMMMKKKKNIVNQQLQLGHHTMIPSHIPDYFSQANDFEINSCQKSSRECSAATSALLCFLLQMLYDDEPGVEDVSCGLSLKKNLV